MILHTQVRENRVSLPNETLKQQVVLPSSEIIGEGAAIFPRHDRDNIGCPRQTGGYVT